MSWFKAAFGYGLGKAAGKAIFGEGDKKSASAEAPIRSMTEEEILADEKRFAEDERRLEGREAKK